MKHWTTTVRRFIPRRTLHRVMDLYKIVAHPYYKGNNMECSICGKTARKFMSFGASTRRNAMCPHCFSLERHRLLWLYLQNETDLFSQVADGRRMLHVAPEKFLMETLERQLGDNYITADLDSPLAKVKMNIEDIPFPEGEFDVIFCNHVLEHVGDDRRALREFYRVMKPGGWGILLVPYDPKLETTYEDSSITSKQLRQKAFGQWDHVRKYGMDYPKRLEEAGFEVASIDYIENFTENQKERLRLGSDTIFLVRKPAKE